MVLAMCIPNACTNYEAEQILSSVMEREITFGETSCFEEDDRSISTHAKATM